MELRDCIDIAVIVSAGFPARRFVRSGRPPMPTTAKTVPGEMQQPPADGLVRAA